MWNDYNLSVVINDFSHSFISRANEREKDNHLCFNFDLDNDHEHTTHNTCRQTILIARQDDFLMKCDEWLEEEKEKREKTISYYLFFHKFDFNDAASKRIASLPIASYSTRMRSDASSLKYNLSFLICQSWKF